MKIERPDIDIYFMSIAETTATRSTCRHRHQGAVLVRDKHILATGYNGSAPGQIHCIDTDCAKDLTGICRAEGLHAESNAIISAARMGISTDNSTMYCIYSPCRSCSNMLKVAGVTEVIYEEVYSGFPEGPKYLDSLGIKNRRIR